MACNIVAAGSVALVNGVAVVESSDVWDQPIFAQSQEDGGTPGWLRITDILEGESFTIRSSSASDTSTVGWMILQEI